jgi:hypothetical protein
MIISKLNEATFSDEESRERIIGELASQPDETLDALLEVLKFPPKGRWPVAFQVIRVIGYPRNALAIPLLIDEISDPNSPSWNEAMQALVEMGPEIVIPYFIQTMLDGTSHRYWIDAIHGICQILNIKSVGREYAVPCGPAISYLLSQDDLSDAFEKLDPEYLLDVLEKIGPECGVYALPALRHVVNKEGMNKIGQQAWNLIASFDEQVREPYKLLLAALQKTEQNDQ